MDSVLQAIFSWQFILFCLAVFGITLVLRKIAEYLLANVKFFSKESKIWRDLILPILPVIVGIVFSLLATSYPYPIEMTAASARMVWGITAGLSSGLAYRLLNSFLVSFITSKIPGVKVTDPNLDEPEAPPAEENKTE